MAAGRVTGLRPNDQGSILSYLKAFSLFHIIQTVSGAYQMNRRWGGGLLPQR